MASRTLDRWRARLLAALLLIVLPARAFAAPPPAWDKKLPADKRFVLLWCTGSGVNKTCPAVLDKETGLVWERTPSAALVADWDSASGAVATCYAKAVGDRLGWRLPTVEELYSLVDPTTSAPSLPTGHPFLGVQSIPGDVYWSITAQPSDSAHVFGVAFDSVGIELVLKSGGFAYVWCVRGGHGHDPR